MWAEARHGNEGKALREGPAWVGWTLKVHSTGWHSWAALDQACDPTPPPTSLTHTGLKEVDPWAHMTSTTPDHPSSRGHRALSTTVWPVFSCSVGALMRNKADLQAVIPGAPAAHTGWKTAAGESQRRTRVSLKSGRQKEGVLGCPG